MFAAALLLAPTAPPVAAAPEASVPWWIFIVIGLVVLGAGAALLVFSMRAGNKPAEETCPKCGKVMMSDWPKCMFCKTPRGEAGGKKAALEFVGGPQSGRNVPLDAEVTTIGSAPGSTVQLTDAGVSRKHAGIRKADGAYELADLGSTNGVYVNGEKVARRKLQLGDVIRVGATEMIFKG